MVKVLKPTLAIDPNTLKPVGLDYRLLASGLVMDTGTVDRMTYVPFDSVGNIEYDRSDSTIILRCTGGLTAGWVKASVSDFMEIYEAFDKYLASNGNRNMKAVRAE